MFTHFDIHTLKARWKYISVLFNYRVINGLAYSVEIFPLKNCTFPGDLM